MNTTYKIFPLYLGELPTFESSSNLYNIDNGVKVRAPFISYLICGNGKNIIVDTGPGPEEEMMAIHSHLVLNIPAEVNMENALKEHNLAISDIDYVINTHLHWDHCFNNKLFKGKPMYVQKAELQYAVAPYDIHEVTYEAFTAGFTPPWAYVATDLILVEGDTKIDDGIELIFTPGHSPGSQSVLVDTIEGPYLICGDTVNVYENWIGNDKLKHICPGIHVNLHECYESFKKIEKIGARILPGHDYRVFDHKVYPPEKKKIES